MATTNVYIVFYSLYGHVETMAREIQKGANSVDGVKATLWQVPETLPERVLEKMKSHPKADDVPVISPEQLLEADGFLFGSPSRFGVMAAQMKAFFDATHPLWATQALAGKPAGIFWSTGFHGGGQELTASVFFLCFLPFNFLPTQCKLFDRPEFKIHNLSIECS
nr:probable NAD(P)H dehydrogenase (quinone) FQR1-like 3 [Ipomoea batatas]GMD15878.1 probable NAD(P)H dehydrogenase (quinone) FQR1-like 3 [Ipomoea batatas]